MAVNRKTEARTVAGLGIKDLKNQIRLRIMRGGVLYIEGEPGTGKTQVVRQVADEYRYISKDYLVSSEMPENFGGLQTADLAERRAVRLMPDIVADICDTRVTSGRPVVAFFDEINNGSAMVFSACMKLLHEGHAGGFAVPEDTIFICAGNSPESSSIAGELPAPLYNRMSCVTFAGATADEMREYMIDNKWHPAVISFLDQNSQFIRDKADFTVGGPQPTARSWEEVSKDLLFLDGQREQGRDVPPRLRMHSVASHVGEEAARMIEATIKFGDNLTPWRDVKKNPNKAHVPEAFIPAYMQVMSVLAGLSSDVSSVSVGADATVGHRKKSDETIEELCRAAISYARRLPKEVLGVFVHSANRDPALLGPLNLHWSIEELRHVSKHVAAGRSLILGEKS